MEDCGKAFVWVTSKRPVLALLSVSLIIIIAISVSSSSNNKTTESPDAQKVQKTRCEYAQGASGEFFCSLQAHVSSSSWNWVCTADSCKLSDSNGDISYPLLELNDDNMYVPAGDYKDCEAGLKQLLNTPTVNYSVVEALNHLSFNNQTCPFPVGSMKLLYSEENRNGVNSESFFSAGGFDASDFISYRLDDSVFIFEPYS
uniref:Uncharacterized protein n=1 Tax=Aplanochytrium stocchinoi TaxID=215587 RepID=A0A7S3LG22_9STRA